MNSVVHFEVIGNDGEKTRAFFSSLFGWSFNTDNPLKYGATMPPTGAAGIPGGVSGPYPGSADTYATFYVMVENIESKLAAVEALGGRQIMPPMSLPGGMRVAQFEDINGIRIGLLEASGKSA